MAYTSVQASQTDVSLNADRCLLVLPVILQGPAPAKAVGGGEMLGSLVERDIYSHIPVRDRTEAAADGIFSRDQFTYNSD